MEWTDSGIVLGVRRHGEANAILELMTREHGRHLGLVRGGAGSRMRPVLQPGNSVRAVWRARLDEHLGHFLVEGLELRAASFLPVSHAVFGVTHLAALCRLLPERDPHPAIYDAVLAVLDRMHDRALAGAGVARFELQLIAELGFGLDLGACAVTGAAGDLAYVSPKSGRAVSRAAGAPWADKLLRLPRFLGEEELGGAPSPEELAEAFALTGFFLSRHVFEPRGEAAPEARAHFLAAVLRAPAVGWVDR
jgi:DNA repair protein RecO (recombination protein O)